MTQKFIVKGMTCAACSSRVEKFARKVSGVSKADVNLLAGTLIAEIDDETVIQQVIRAVENAGYGIVVPSVSKKEPEDNGGILKAMKVRIVVSFCFLSVLMYFTMGHMLGIPAPEWYHIDQNAMLVALLQFFLTIPVIYMNRSYYKKGIKALFSGGPNMDSLIAVGSGAALVYGIIALFVMAFASGRGDWDTVLFYRENLYFESAAMILTLITLGKFLEMRAKGKTGDAIRGLMDLNPKTAIKLVDGVEYEVAVKDLQVGDVLVVRSGGRIAVDGTVISGRASVDQSALTGESVPVEKATGDHVSAATINSEGYLEIRAERVGDDTTLSQVIRMVEDAGGSKAPIARLADKIAGVFVPVVMLISAATFIVWLLVGQTLEFSLTSAITVLVISCPCALGLATPVGIMVGTGRGASMGILFKNAESLENLHRVNTVVLDKTGTLTQGKPSVTDVLPGCMDADELLSLAAAIEEKSEHPFAKAIIEKYGKDINLQVDFFETLPGQGVSASVAGVQYYGGNLRLMHELGVKIPDCKELELQGKTPLHFADSDKRYLGTIAAADILKPDSVEAVTALHSMGLRVIMLTGDNSITAGAVAANAGINEVISDVLPGDKAAAILKIRESGQNVLMVGDGINDAPALATADVGMALGAGTDIAMESADVVLMNSSLVDVCHALELSKATIRNIRQNLFWAFFYNCLGIPVAAGVLYPLYQLQLSPMIGAAAMSLSSVFVVTNALRLRAFRPRKITSNKSKHETITQEVQNMEIIIKVEGMMCTHCKARVESVCKAVPGSLDAIVDLEKKQVTVMGNASEDALKKAIIDAGYEVIE